MNARRFLTMDGAGMGYGNGHGRLGGAKIDGDPMYRALAKPAASPMPAPAASTISIAEVAITAEISVRQDFSALATFVPRVTLGADGRARVPVKLPDNLTRYRVMAVASAGENRFGTAESQITARLPLMVRPSAPRFLNYGDKFELPVVLQNQTERPMDVDVAARATNAEVEGIGRRVTVPANDRVEVRLPASAAKAGTARFQIGAVSGKWSDAAQIELPVWTPATTEAFATYGTIDEGAIAQPVKMPDAVVPQFGGIEITTSSTALQALTDAVLYLARYPFECSEQLSSRILAVAALKDVLTAFQAKGMPKPEVLLESVKRDLERLSQRQAGDGGWGLWRGPSWPWTSVHVAHALARAKAKGFGVDGMLPAAHQYLRYIDGHIPSWYPPDARRAIVAYALYVRAQLGDSDRARAKKLVDDAGGAEKMPLESLGFVLDVLTGDPASAPQLAAIRKHIANRATETAGAAHFTTSYQDGEYLLFHSDRRADAILLEALIADNPKNDLIPKRVTGLLGHRKAGHWLSTQENSFVLLALDRYFNTYEKTTPDFVARAWLGDRFAGEHAFKGRSTDRADVFVPMRYLAEIGSADLTLQKDGPGRLYYRVGMDYAPADLRPPPLERGFVVSRAYEGADNAGDVRRDADGTWRVKAGSRVRVRVAMVAPARRVHVALTDPLPAGFEPINPAFAASGSVPADPSAGPRRGWWGPWYEHQNMRDDRVEAFASLLWEGVYDYTYVARATTPGTFVVPPPKAEEMYSPETFGRGAGDRVIVE
jgi:uncharacterized protein YfaS (alpha-2-macroglobulin family)